MREKKKQKLSGKTEESVEKDASSDPFCDPANAANLSQSFLGLSNDQTAILETELNLTDEDPLLVIRVNPNFTQGNINVNAVCDAIATYNYSWWSSSRWWTWLSSMDFSF